MPTAAAEDFLWPPLAASLLAASFRLICFLGLASLLEEDTEDFLRPFVCNRVESSLGLLLESESLSDEEELEPDSEDLLLSRKGICRLSVFRAAAVPVLAPASATVAAPFGPPLVVVVGVFLVGGVVASSSSSLSEPELLELEPDDDELVPELELLDEVEVAFFSSLRLAAVGTAAGGALADALVGRSSGTGTAAGVAAASAGLLMPLLMCSAAFLAACRWGTYARTSSIASSFELGAVVGGAAAAGFSFSTSTSRSLDGATLSFSFAAGVFSRCGLSLSATTAAAAAVGLIASG